MIRYEKAPELDEKIREIIGKLEMKFDISRIRCVRSRGSKARFVIARCHGIPKILQKALDIRANYVIEVISERFDSFSEEDKTKTLIHELMHIPKCFGGGFRHHDYVNKKSVDKMYELFRK
jgi:predicted metallopeptidase